jgi:hypothetical protein
MASDGITLTEISVRIVGKQSEGGITSDGPESMASEDREGKQSEGSITPTQWHCKR